MKHIFFVLFFCLSAFVLAQVGINTDLPKSTLDINGNVSFKEVGITNSNVLDSASLFGGITENPVSINDGVYISMTPTTGSDAFILPNATTIPGRIYFLRNISDTVKAKIYSSGGSFFASNSSTASGLPLEMNSNAITKSLIFISDGTNWVYFY